MGKKRLALLSFEALFLGICLVIVLQSTSLFIYATNRLKTCLDIYNIKAFFELTSQEVVNSYIADIVRRIQNIFGYIFDTDLTFIEKLLIFLDKLTNFLLDLIINFCNYGLNILLVIAIVLHETFTKEEEDVKYSKGAQIYLKIIEIKNKCYKSIKDGAIKFYHLLKKYKRIILVHILVLLLSCGVAYLILVEFLLFVEVYIIRVINLETYLLIFRFFTYLFVKIYPIAIRTPLFILTTILIILIFLSAVRRARFKLKKNHERLKKFVREDITQTTFINGPPGSGKTLLNSSLSLIAEENYMEDLRKNMLEYQTKYPQENFAEIRNKSRKDHPVYYKNYDYLVNRQTFLTSNYAIYSPYFMTYSKIFNFDWMRKNKKAEQYPLEEYIVISISELDKEYNSHDDMKAVGEDGAATFFSTVSHDLKRHTKIFCDYQLKDQVPLRIRGNSEFFYSIQAREKKYPLLLYVYYLPIIGFKNLLLSWIDRYETKRKNINKHTLRKGQYTFKRNDYTFLYAWFRFTLIKVQKLCKWFDQYWYFKIKGNLSYDDGNMGDKKNLNINICDLSINEHRLYDSTFLSFAYESKKNYEFRKLEPYTSLTPSIDELTKCNSRFYNKINNIDQSNDNKEESEDDYVDL